MKVYFSDKDNFKIQNAVVTIGTFDGVHFAHQSILNDVAKLAKNENLNSVVVTFNPHPKHIVSNDVSLELLSSLDEKIILFEKNKIDFVYVINFTQEFSKLNYDDFFKNYILKNFDIKYFFVGYNHAFGKNREAGILQLEKLSIEHNFNLKIIEAVKLDDYKVSSTEIRKKLINGEIELANKLLNYEFTFSGIVIKGDGRGRKLGFPTANLKLNEPLKLLPKNGIYIVEVELQNLKYFGLMNIGVIPTFYDKHERRAEVYILDFNKDIYDEILKVNLLHRLRDELKFSSVEELIDAMKQDEINGKNWLNLHKERINDVNKRTETRTCH